MGLCKHFVHNARYAKCLYRPIVIINKQYTKGEIHFINKLVRNKRIWPLQVFSSSGHICSGLDQGRSQWVMEWRRFDTFLSEKKASGTKKNHSSD